MLNIGHKISSETEINWEESIEACRELKKDRVKDSTWRSKYDPVLTNVIKAVKKRVKVPKNGTALVKVTLKQWQQGTVIRRYKRPATYGFLRFCVAKRQFEYTLLPPAATYKNFVSNK